jgi:hypothetical protein
VAVLHSCTEMSTRLAVLHSHVAGKSGAPAPPSTIAKATAASAGTIERVEYGVLFGERPRAAGLADLRWEVQGLEPPEYIFTQLHTVCMGYYGGYLPHFPAF